MIVNCIHAVSRVVGITRQKFMLRLCRPFTGMSQREQIMPALHFLKKQDVGRHGRDGLLDAMDARSCAYGTNAFVDIPGRDAKFHAFSVAMGLPLSVAIGIAIGIVSLIVIS